MPAPTVIVETLKAPHPAALTPAPTSTTGLTPSPIEATETRVRTAGVQPAQDFTVSTKGTLIRIAPSDGPYLTIENNLSADLKALAHVSRVERYLVIELGGSTDAVIGVEPGAPLRVLREGEQATAEVYIGEDFTGVDAGANFAIAGKVRSVPDHAMAGMVHEYLVGQTFGIFGYPDRIRVIGKYRSDSKSQDFNLFFPIETAQEAFEIEGEISYLLVTVDSQDNVRQVEENLRALLSTSR